MKLVRSFLIVTLAALPLFAQQPQTAAPITESWTIDKSHSSAEFKVRHLMANVGGRFNDFDAVIHLDRTNPANSSVEFTIQATSIDTANKNRDEHLRSPDFFDVAKFPTITFKSTSIKERSKDLYDVTGDFTMHGVTKRITIPVEFLGFGRGPGGSEKRFDRFAIAEAMKQDDAVPDDDRATEALPDLPPPDHTRTVRRKARRQRRAAVDAVSIRTQKLRPVVLGRTHHRGERDYRDSGQSPATCHARRISLLT
jgi:polyisoprenoid-binding protein YceI